MSEDSVIAKTNLEQSTIAADGKERTTDSDQPQQPSTALSGLPAGRKALLLFCFCLAMFIDAAGVSATFLMTSPIAADLNISFANEAWVLGTYSMVFAACLLFAGRLADLYSPSHVYIIGFAGISIFYLIISFMTNDIAFYVLRAISALLAVLT
jgi:MFS family permease